MFGDSRGEPTADDIWALAKERNNGISRTDVRDLFSRNKKAREIGGLSRSSWNFEVTAVPPARPLRVGA